MQHRFVINHFSPADRTLSLTVNDSTVDVDDVDCSGHWWPFSRMLTWGLPENEGSQNG